MSVNQSKGDRNFSGGGGRGGGGGGGGGPTAAPSSGYYSAKRVAGSGVNPNANVNVNTGGGRGAGGVAAPNEAHVQPSLRDHIQKPTGPPMPSIPMKMPFHQSLHHIPFGAPTSPLQSQGMPNSALQVPHPMPLSVGNPPQQVFVPGVPHHQRIIHPTPGLTFSSQMGPQNGSMGIGMGFGPQFQQQQPMGNFSAGRRAVNISHPDTKEVTTKLAVSTHGEKVGESLPTVVEESHTASVTVPETAPLTSEADATSGKVKGNTSKGKKKIRDILKNADARGTTSDLYNAYKRPEEKKETLSAEIVESNTSVKSSEKAVMSNERREPSKVVPEDWEDAADMFAPHMGTVLKREDENDGMTKKYSRDFLLKFLDPCTNLPEGFVITSDIAEALIASSINIAPHPSPGRGGVGGDKSARLDRHNNLSFDDNWNKGSVPIMGGQGWDLRLAMGHPGSGNHGGLQTLRGQPPNQYTGGILPGQMPSPRPHGHPMQHNNSVSDRWQPGSGNHGGLQTPSGKPPNQYTGGILPGQTPSPRPHGHPMQHNNSVSDRWQPGSGIHGGLQIPWGQPPNQYTGGILPGQMPSPRPQGHPMQHNNSVSDRWQPESGNHGGLQTPSGKPPNQYTCGILPGQTPSPRPQGHPMQHNNSVSDRWQPGSGNHGGLQTPWGQPPNQYTGGILPGQMPSPRPHGHPMQHNNSVSHRWQPAINDQQGLMSSPHTPMMHKAERKCQVNLTDEEQAKQSQLKGISNKLTPQNFEKLFEQVKQLNIDNADTLSCVKDQLAEQEKVAQERDRVAKELQKGAEERERALEHRVEELEEQVKTLLTCLKQVKTLLTCLEL